jgi:hypothetical protein
MDQLSWAQIGSVRTPAAVVSTSSAFPQLPRLRLVAAPADGARTDEETCASRQEVDRSHCENPAGCPDKPTSVPAILSIQPLVIARRCTSPLHTRLKRDLIQGYLSILADMLPESLKPLADCGPLEVVAVGAGTGNCAVPARPPRLGEIALIGDHGYEFPPVDTELSESCWLFPGPPLLVLLPCEREREPPAVFVFRCLSIDTREQRCVLPCLQHC